MNNTKNIKIYLKNTKRVLKEYLLNNHTKSEIQNLFYSAGFKELTQASWRKAFLIDQYYTQIDWFQKNEAENLFPIIFAILNKLKIKCEQNIAGGELFRQQFTSILEKGLRRDGADFSINNVYWVKEDENNHVERNQNMKIDFLLVCALTEEYQVIVAVLDHLAKKIGESVDIRNFQYKINENETVNIATACAHHIGAVSLGIITTPLLSKLQPSRVALVGIAAAIDPSELNLGDVPCANQVFSMDNIAVQNGLKFRPDGFPTDPVFLKWIGRLRTDINNYYLWQKNCKSVIKKVIKTVNIIRRKKIIIPESFDSPHILTGYIAGGPFLIRDKLFRNSLSKSTNRKSSNTVKITTPVHSKLIAAEMEAHGFMKAAHEAGIPASVLKGISDLGDANKSQLEIETGGFFRAYACSNAVMLFLHSLRQSY